MYMIVTIYYDHLWETSCVFRSLRDVAFDSTVSGRGAAGGYSVLMQGRARGMTEHTLETLSFPLTCI